MQPGLAGLCLPTERVSRVLLGLWSTEGWTHGFVNGRQALYQLDYILSLNLAFFKWEMQDFIFVFLNRF